MRKDVGDLSNEKTIDMRLVADALRFPFRGGTVDWKNGTRINEIYKFLKEFLKGRKDANFFECRPIWLTALTTEISTILGVEQIGYYSKGSNVYLPTKRMRMEKMRPEAIIDDDIEVYKIMPDDFINVVKVEKEDEVLLCLYPKQIRYINLNDLDNIILPAIDPNKKIYFSGPLPSWFVSSLIQSYANREKAILQNGIGFYTIASQDESAIGKLESSPSRINFIQASEKIKKYIEAQGCAVPGRNEGGEKRASSIEH